MTNIQNINVMAQLHPVQELYKPKLPILHFTFVKSISVSTITAKRMNNIGNIYRTLNTLRHH